MREQLWRYYPQLLAATSDDIAAPWALDLWRRLPTPAAAQRVREATLAKLLQQHRIRRVDAAATPRPHRRKTRTRPPRPSQSRRHRRPTRPSCSRCPASAPASSLRCWPRVVTRCGGGTTTRFAVSAGWRRSPGVRARACSSCAAWLPTTGCATPPTTGLASPPTATRSAAPSIRRCAAAAMDTPAPCAQWPTACLTSPAPCSATAPASTRTVQEMSQRERATHALDRHSPRLPESDDETDRGRCGHVVCGVSKSRWARLCVHGDGRVHGPSRHLTPTSIAVTTTRKGTCKMVGSPFLLAIPSSPTSTLGLSDNLPTSA